MERQIMDLNYFRKLLHNHQATAAAEQHHVYPDSKSTGIAAIFSNSRAWEPTCTSLLQVSQEEWDSMPNYSPNSLVVN
jgi:hypothetical protein